MDAQDQWSLFKPYYFLKSEWKEDCLKHFKFFCKKRFSFHSKISIYVTASLLNQYFHGCIN